MLNFILNIFFILLFHAFSKELSIDTIKISWNDNSDSTNIVMTNPMNSNNWFAFGLSNDQLMGDDDVALCKVSENKTVSLLHYYNNGKSPSLLLSTNPTVGFTNIKTSYTNGVATCSFTRAVKMLSLAKYFDFSKSYYILAAYGPIRSGEIGKHSFHKASSSI